MPTQESPIFSRSYALLLWLLPATVRFPRHQRFVLAGALQRSALHLHERLIEAAHVEGAARRAHLTNADVELDKVRHLLRLCRDLDLLSNGQYEHAARQVAEIGRLLGGWQKSTGSPEPAAR